MNVLMLDIGGSNAKLMNALEGEIRKIPSGRDLTPGTLVSEVQARTSDWTWDVVSIGYPGLVRRGRPFREPHLLGRGWLNFDFEAAFGKPVRLINDAAMQALGNYLHGRLLFLGFGTSIGACLIADDTVIPIEIGLVRLARKERLIDRLSKEAFEKDGADAWSEAVAEAVALLQDVFRPSETVLGGGNARCVDPLPSGCRVVDNASAYVGALRLWDNADLFAIPADSTWKITRRAASPPPP